MAKIVCCADLSMMCLLKFSNAMSYAMLAQRWMKVTAVDIAVFIYTSKTVLVLIG